MKENVHNELNNSYLKSFPPLKYMCIYIFHVKMYRRLMALNLIYISEYYILNLIHILDLMLQVLFRKKYMEFKAVKPWCDFSLKVCEREQHSNG